jgi:hypothetical protein
MNSLYQAIEPQTQYLKKQDNFNSWNFDLSYSWWFAQEVRISIYIVIMVWNLIVEKSYQKSKNIFNSDLTSVLSVSVRYFIDYNHKK